MKIIISSKIQNWKKYKKTAPILTMTKQQAKHSTGLHQVNGEIIPFVDQNDIIQTLEGPQKIKDNDLLCKGIMNQIWPQPKQKVQKKFILDKEYNNRGMNPWKKWNPKGNPVQAIQLKINKTINNMNGKSGDYMLRDISNIEDKWIVEKEIFEKSYQEIK